MEKEQNVFEILNQVDVSKKIKQKIGLSYLSWSDAWAELKKIFPEAYSTIYSRKVKTTTTTVNEDTQLHSTTTTVSETEDEIPYFTDGKTCYVKVGVTINDKEYIEYYPIMDNRNNAVPLSTVTMTVVNKALQRAFVKACARHGLGLYIYSGEDLPEGKERPAAATIDYNEIETLINGMTFSTSEPADVLAPKVSELYTKLIETQAGQYLNEYMSRLLKDYGIKKVSENLEALNKFYSLMEEINKRLG